MTVGFRGHVGRAELIRGLVVIAFSLAIVGYSTSMLVHALTYGEIKVLARHSHEFVSAAAEPGRYLLHAAGYVIGIALFSFGAWAKGKQLRQRWFGIDDHRIDPTNFSNK